MTKGVTVREIINFHKLVSYSFKGRDLAVLVNKFQKMTDAQKREIINRINESSSQIILPSNLKHLKDVYKKTGENMLVKLTNAKKELQDQIALREKAEYKYEATRQTNEANAMTIEAVTDVLTSQAKVAVARENNKLLKNMIIYGQNLLPE